MKRPDRILVIRNDKIGDFMLVWPALRMLKNCLPDTSITALVPAYTADLAHLCEWIDETIIDDGEATIAGTIRLSRECRHHNFDASIAFFSQTRTAMATWLAGIDTRIGPATKVAQLFLNRRLKQNRSRSLKAEFEYNLDLVDHLCDLLQSQRPGRPSPPYLRFDSDETAAIKSDFIDKNSIADDRKLICIHPGTGGSAINLSLVQYAALARTLIAQHPVHIVITAGPGEREIASELGSLLGDEPHTIYHSTDGIIDFCKHIAFCDVFISGSTGPLHIAGALNVNTAAFYPARRSATALRWQTLNAAEKRVSFSPDKFVDEQDMQKIDVIAAGETIAAAFLERH